MNNELFDKIIHDNLVKNQFVPSSQMHKKFGKRLFFQNLITFHKFKLIAALLLISSATVSFYYYYNTNDVNSKQIVQQNWSRLYISDSNLAMHQEEKNNSSESIPSNKVEESKLSNTSFDTKDKMLHSYQQNVNVYDLEQEIASNNSIIKGNSLTQNFSNSSPKTNSSQTTKEVIETVVFNKETKYFESNKEQDNYHKYQLKKINLSNDLSLKYPVNVELTKNSFKKKRILKREFSIDVYKGLYAYNSIENQIENQEYNEFHWDFYQNTNELKTNHLGGISANYAIGTQFFKLKSKVGISYSKIKEEKAIYEFQEVTDPAWLDVFEVEELSWVNTYGEDTCTQCLFASNTPEFQENFALSHNEYTYLNVPVFLGGEFNFKYLSLDLLAGIQWSHLRQTNGLFVKQENPSDPQFYYWDDLIITTMNNQQNMLRTNHFSWMVNANVRFRVIRQMDILMGYQMGASLKGITNEGYFINKDHQFYNFNIGVTFYPNRLYLRK